ncbi:U3 small nucleolar RNA-associated protein NOL7 [Eucyclogobius newberryi]|uniref:U3 small nucleolar RNA-associated protein NOL7 n=1 Tax=Eucyclogobius newberryi TaxID=166745 RepID=UPI003B5A23A1
MEGDTISDDEAPEEMTFASARDEALRRVKSALETAKREKEQLKQKRRRRQELFQEQKKRRLLPKDVLDQMDSAPQGKEDFEDEDPEEPEEEILSASRSLRDTYTVTTAKQHMCFQQQAAQDFLQSRLYGPGSQRSTNNQLLSLQNKKGPHKRAAAQFIKKSWAPREKAKAEKVKRRWIHRQKIV